MPHFFAESHKKAVSQLKEPDEATKAKARNRQKINEWIIPAAIVALALGVAAKAAWDATHPKDRRVNVHAR